MYPERPVLLKSTVVYSGTLGLRIPPLSHPELLSVLQTPLMVSALYRCTIFKSFILYFHYTFSLFRYA